MPITLLELSCLALFLIPRTAGLGTLLLTGYFGGATVTHIIGSENFIPPLVVGLLIWVGAYFRMPEFQEFLPVEESPRQFRLLRRLAPGTTFSGPRLSERHPKARQL